MRVFLAVVGVGLALADTPSHARTEKAPSWLVSAAAETVPPGEGAEARVLFRECSVDLESDGRIVQRERWVIRIDRSPGQDRAVGRVSYRTDSGRLRSFEGWLLREGGGAERLDPTRQIDVAQLNEQLYNEVRMRVLDARPEASPGAVLGFESIVEDRALFGQFEWLYQESLPVHRSRFMIRLPEGWSAECRGDLDAIDAQIDIRERRWTWERRTIPAFVDEKDAPEPGRHLGLLGVTCRPASSSGFVAFEHWTDVSRWAADWVIPRGSVPPALRLRAVELVANATTRLDSLRAVASFVQGVRYASIPLGLGTGGGYRARPPEIVLEALYGDCKDKSNLLRALLGEIGIQAYLVLLRAGDSTAVRRDWVSPRQFDHCIVAIPVEASSTLPAILDRGEEEPLLLFDPTHPDLPLGDLPEADQGGLGLLVGVAGDPLVRLPARREGSRLERSLELDVAADGTASGRLTMIGVGTAAEAMLLVARTSDGSAYDTGGPRPHFANPTIENGVPGGVLRITFSVGRFRPGSSMSPDRLILRPICLPVLGLHVPQDGPRAHPVFLSPFVSVDSVRIRLPEGFRPQETPVSLRIDGPTGSYSSSWSTDDNDIVWRREVQAAGGTVPASRYDELRTFYSKVRAAEQGAIVLAVR